MKGSKMIASNNNSRATLSCNGREYLIKSLDQIDLDEIRSGVKMSVEKFLNLIVVGKRNDGSEANNLTCVLPTRYGKSDAIRLLATLSRKIGIGVSFVLSPNEFLRGQIVSSAKVGDMCVRYDFDKRLPNTFGEIKTKAELTEGGPGKLLLASCTLQMFATREMLEPRKIDGLENKSLLKKIFENLRSSSGGKVLVMIDEGHECGDEKVRGEMVREMTDAGAIVILFTATPYRSDGDTIPGFRQEHISEEERSLYKVIDEDADTNRVLIERRDYMRIKYRLIPDFEVTFAQAWNEKTKSGDPILCALDHRLISIKLDNGIMLRDMVNDKGLPSNTPAIRDAINKAIVRERAKMFTEWARRCLSRTSRQGVRHGLVPQGSYMRETILTVMNQTTN